MHKNVKIDYYNGISCISDSTGSDLKFNGESGKSNGTITVSTETDVLKVNYVSFITWNASPKVALSTCYSLNITY